MIAMQLVEFGKPLEMREVAPPTLRPRDVLVKVRAAGVCGTDLKIVAGKHPKVPATALPRTPGHEVSGTVVELGSGLGEEASYLLGKDVVVYFYESCGRCEFCRDGREPLCGQVTRQYGFTCDGGFAELMAVPVENVVLFEGIEHERACILTDAVATAYHAVVTRGRVRSGERIAIFGCGGIGLHAIQIAKLQGAEVVGVDVDLGKLQAARQFGADHSLLFEELRGGNAYRADLVLDTVGSSETVQLSLEILKNAGRLVLLGYRDDVQQTVYLAVAVKKEICIIGSRASGRSEVREVIRLAMDGRITPVVGRTFPLRMANEALDELRKGECVGRTVLVV